MALSPPPIKDGNFPYSWQEWFRQLRDYVYSPTGSIPWSAVGKTGSNLSDIATRAHDTLQSILGSGTYHLSSTEQATISGSTTGTWTPTFTNLTVVLGGGSVSYSGRYTRIGRMVFWQVIINPVGGATTASTAGTTYNDLPIAATFDDTSMASNNITKLSIGLGVLDSINGRNWPPTWAASTNMITLSGQYEV